MVVEDAKRFKSNDGKQIPHSAIDKEFLAAPIKSATDKFALLPEFLKLIGNEESPDTLAIGALLELEVYKVTGKMCTRETSLSAKSPKTKSVPIPHH
ncbi:hypothetical protein ACE6H2_006394 [Prunus campanulata]